MGLTFLLAPDVFWNPKDGLLSPHYTFVTTTQAVLDSDEAGHFDACIRCGLRGSGSSVLGIMLFHLFFAKPEHEEFLLRYKLVLFGLEDILLLQAILFGSPNFLNKQALFVFACYNIFMTMGLWQIYQKTFPRQPHVTKSWALSAIGAFAYGLPFGLALALIPQQFGPQGLFPYFANTAQDSVTFDDAHIFVVRLEGISLLAYLYSIWDSRSKPCTEIYVMTALFETLMFLDGALDPSGQTNRITFGWTLGWHYLFITFLAFELDLEDTNMKTKTTNLIQSNFTTEDNEPVPDLAPIGGDLIFEAAEKKTN